MRKRAAIFVFFLMAAFGLAAVFFRQRVDPTLEERTAALLMVGLNQRDFVAVKKAAQEGIIGGVVVFGSAFRNEAELKAKIAEIRGMALRPLLIAIDGEGGKVLRLGDAPSAAEMGAKGDRFTREASLKLGQELKAAGVSLNFAPVVDLAMNPENPSIAKMDRAFGKSSEVVTARARAFIEGQREAGLLVTLKHFPGLGSAGADSHLGAADVSATWTEQELAPYRALLGPEFAGAVMVGHIFNSKLDPEAPASLSAKVVNGLLRGKLGFRGVAITDDLQMGAVTKKYSMRESLRAALLAGEDLLLVAEQYRWDDIRSLHRQIVRLVESGEVPRARVDEAYERVQALRARAN